ncbi:MAG: hypothetical protein KatS3mg111_1344 [Pirellulaceae bacterium]|nr:MAG: hypothetical protein KatS3mg111_1344 [Pirellulaceae bacterium]
MRKVIRADSSRCSVGRRFPTFSPNTRIIPMETNRWMLGWCFLGLPMVVALGPVGMTQGPRGEGGGAATAGADTQPPLVDQQQQVAERFERLERLLLRSAELESLDNPTRAALLQQAVQLSKQAQLAESLSQAAGDLRRGQYSEALQRQRVGVENLRRLLDLLQSENRDQRVREQREQIRRWIEETQRLSRLQGSLRGRTEGGQSLEQAAEDQEKLARKAAEIIGELRGEQPNDESARAREETPPGQSPAGQSGMDGEPDADQEERGPRGKESEPEPDGRDVERGSEDAASDRASDQAATEDAGPNDAEMKPSESRPQPDSAEHKELASEADSSGSPDGSSTPENAPRPDGAPSPGASEQPTDGRETPVQGQQSGGEPAAGDPPSSSTPADGSPPTQGQDGAAQQPASRQPSSSAEPQDPMQRAAQRIEQAREKMREAQKALEEAQREGAVERQREAEQRLREAVEELEQILRQLREEEIERSLASLESRLRKMLEMQTQVLEESQRLHEIAGESNADRQVQIRANKLAIDEKQILAEGERAFLLLKEEGSSAAFPEAVQQMNTDIAHVVERLQRADVGKLTLVIEQEIVNSLEEMINALVQVQKENEQRKQQQQSQQSQPSPPGEQPLVDKLAELRLVRTLQMRINKRTDALAQMLEDPSDPVGQAKDDQVRRELEGLAERQQDIQAVTRDIIIGIQEEQ